MRRFVVGLLVSLTLASASFGQTVASYPNRPIRLIIPFAPGGASDFIGRIVAANFPEVLGQQAVVDNRPGAAGNIALEVAAKAAPDGYTLFLGNAGTITVNPSLYPDLTVKPLHDFIAVTRIASVPGIMVAHPAFPPSTVQELIEHARKLPGKFNYGSPGAGSSQRILMELLKKDAKIDLVEVPYKGGAGPAIAGLVAGETQVAFATVASVTGFVKAGKLKPIATLTEQRLAAFGNVPTVVEAGFPRIVDSQWQGVFAPRGTPPEVVHKVNAGLLRIMQRPNVAERFAGASAQAFTTETPAEFAAFVERESRHWESIIREVGATVNQ